MWDKKKSSPGESRNPYATLRYIRKPMALLQKSDLRFLVGFLALGIVIPLFSCQGGEEEFGAGLGAPTLIAPPVPPDKTPITPPPPIPPPQHVSTWNWENPLPQGNNLHAVWVDPDKNGNDEIITGGDVQTLMSSNGPLWNQIDTSALSPGSSGTIHAISGQTSQGIVLAVQNSKNVFVRKNGVWSSKHTSIGQDGIEYYGVWASNNPEGDFFVVGKDAQLNQVDTTFHGYVYHVTNQGTTWTLELDRRAQGLRAVFGTGTGTSMMVYAVGDDGAMFRRNSNGVWLELNASHILPPLNTDLAGVFATTDPNSILYVVGTNGTIATSKDNGITWNAETLPTVASHTALKSAWGFGNDVYVTGATGIVLHGVLTTGNIVWTVVASGLAQGNLNAIFGQIKNGKIASIYAVGDGGVLLQNQNGNWSTLSATRTSQMLQAGWARSADEVYAVGTQATILRKNSQGQWTQETPENYNSVQDNPTLNAISGYSQDTTHLPEVYAVGAGGTIIHRTLLGDGSAVWLYDGSYLTNQDWHGVWVGGTDVVYAVGDQGRIAIKSKVVAPASPWQEPILLPDGNGGTFTINNNLTAVLGVSSQQNQVVYIGGDQGLVLRFNGTAWSKETLGITDSVLTFMGTDEKSLYAVTKSEIFTRNSNGTWVSAYKTNGTDQLLSGIFVPQQPNAALLIGTSESEGVLWQSYTTPVHFSFNPPIIKSYTLNLINAVTAVNNNDIYLFGQNGSILHYH